MVPAQKRLEGLDVVVFKTDNRLIEQLEFTVGERALQVPLQFAAGLHARIHFRLIETVGAASVVLRLIKSDIRSFQQFGDFGRIVWRNRNANADVHRNLMTIEIEWLVNRFTGSHGQRRGIGRTIKRCLNDGEFVAAQPRNQVDISDAAAQSVGHALEQLVPGRLSEGVINALQMINVEVQDCEPLSPPNTLELLLKPLAK